MYYLFYIAIAIHAVYLFYAAKLQKVIAMAVNAHAMGDGKGNARAMEL